MQAKNVFALMVGIDKYQSPVPALEGCVNDMRAFADFVELRTRRKGIPLHLNILQNQDATRLKIVEQFERHLTQAKQGDMVVFYYSGHGSQEPAHKLFWPLEEDRKNETIVCYDSRQPDGMDLADKELATLIDLVTKKGASLTVVMDCCNSGSGTRAAMVEASPAGTRVRQTPDFDGLRPLDSYILPREMASSRGAFSFSGATSSERLAVPTPRHVALSATQPFQLAKETQLGGSPRGVFTYSLLEVLSGVTGQLSYEDVVRQVRSLVKQRTSDQSPQLYAAEAADLRLEFLGGSLAQNQNYFYLSHHNTRGWEVDAGAANGIPAVGTGQTRLAVYDPQAIEADLLDRKKAKGFVSIKGVEAARSSVREEGSLQLDKTKQYRSVVSELAGEKLRVHVRGDNTHGVNTATVALGEAGGPATYLQLVTDPRQATYHVLVKNNRYTLLKSTDADDQPLVRQLDGYSVEQARGVAKDLVHIAQWERTLKMSNPGSRLASNAIRVDLLEATGDAVISPGGLGYQMKVEANKPAPAFRVRISNRSGEKLYVSLLYLSSQFEVEPGLLAQGGLWLEPGAEAFALNGRAFRVGISPGHLQRGRTETTEVLKAIFATTELQPGSLKQEEIEAPRAETRSVGEEGTRSLIFDTVGTDSGGDDWNASNTVITVMAV